MVEVLLTQGKVALIDDEDAPRVLAHKWTLLTINRKSKVTYYARRSVMNGDKSRSAKTRSVLLHRFILDAPDGVQVDHKNLDGLDNRRANLRLATNAQNHCNVPSRPSRIGFRGVEMLRHGNGYGARIKVNSELIRIGPFKTAEEAARAYDLMAKHYHGEFATLNFPQG